jgi:hypothetical protein
MTELTPVFGIAGALRHVAQHKKLLQQSIFSEIKRLRGVAEFEIARVSGKVWFWFWFVSNQKSRIRNQKFPMGPLACCSANCQWLPPPPGPQRTPLCVCWGRGNTLPCLLPESYLKATCSTE